MPGDFPRFPDHEIQVGQMLLNFNEPQSTFQLNVVPLEVVSERNEQPQVLMREEDAISFVFTQQQAQLLSRAIQRVISAGRPVCPLCGTPLDGGPHACAKQNGHREVLRVEESEEE
jgi:uncharacterized repeat protein (TIGR03847 family)